jgi:hypothetical protein
MMEEIYKVIKGYENYSVSNYGNVRNDMSGKILKACVDGHGYKKVRLNGKTMNVHRLVSEAFIPNPDNKKCIDHIDTIRTNNNVNNLRYVTNQENSFNMSVPKNNTTGTKGVRWCKQRKKYKVQISHSGKQFHLGYFDKLEDAIKARKLKANELFGEFIHQSERIVNLNITIPKNTKLNINIKVEEDEEYKKLEKEFEELIK